MLIRAARQRGVTLIELMIGLVIVAVLLATGVPAFSAWMQNTQIRNAAEIIKSGLITAQTEAMRRNTLVRFQLTSSIDASCALSTSSPNFVINLGNATSNDPSSACAAPSETTAPFIIKEHAASNGMRNVVLATAQSTLVFNSYGKVVSGGPAVIDVTNPTGGNCALNSGPMTCLRVLVSASGQIRMCNPSHPAGSPQGC